MIDKVELALAARIGIGYRNDAVRRRCAEIAMSEARSRFRMEDDASRPQLDFIVDRMARLELEHGPQIYARAKATGAEGFFNNKPETLTDPVQQDYRQRKAEQQAQTARELREAQARDWNAPYGNKYGHLPTAADRTRMGDPAGWPYKAPWKSER